MHLIITDEDRRLIDSMVERFDPGKLTDKPAEIMDEAWASYLEPERLSLRYEVTAALVAQALQRAGFLQEETDLEHLQAITIDFLGFDTLPPGVYSKLWETVFEALDVRGDDANERAEARSRNLDRALEATRATV